MSGSESGDRVMMEPVDGGYGKRPEIREPYFDFVRGKNHFQCVLVDRGQYGLFAELFKNGTFDHQVGGPFETRQAAIKAADDEREAINSGELDDW